LVTGGGGGEAGKGGRGQRGAGGEGVRGPHSILHVCPQTTMYMSSYH
jgi:hypothetical protein